LREEIVLPERYGSATGGSMIGEKLNRDITPRLAAVYNGIKPDNAAGFTRNDRRSEENNSTTWLALILEE
jgi:hypothetical protein